MDELLVLEGVTRVFGDVHAVSDMSLSIRKGELLTLLGPSGSGKSTVLNMVAGFLSPTAGRILLNGDDITPIPPERRSIGMVFQDYALFPHMSVFDNIAFPLRMRKENPAIIHERVNQVLEAVKLPDMGKRYPDQLSGGQKQRIALARAIVFNPHILLMDEPLGALDEKLRKHMRAEIKQLQRELGITVVLVTHNQDEALSMSDRIAVMYQGRVIQVDRPDCIYEHPATMFVADFVGESNFLSGRVCEMTQDETCVDTVDGLQVFAARRNGVVQGDSVTVMVRPENVFLAPSEKTISSGACNRFSGKIVHMVYGGDAGVCIVSLAQDTVVRAKLPGMQIKRFEVGQKVFVYWTSHDAITLEASASRA